MPFYAARAGMAVTALVLAAVAATPSVVAYGVPVPRPWDTAVCQALALILLVAGGRRGLPRLGTARAAMWSGVLLAALAAQAIRLTPGPVTGSGDGFVDTALDVWMTLDTWAAMGVFTTLAAVAAAAGGRLAGVITALAMAAAMLTAFGGSGLSDITGWLYLAAALLALPWKIGMTARENARYPARGPEE
ncbi:hypothetical protein ACIBH1_38870 [Nonomuraea sp. NPDC050663]|uniref:hypothetical protein n=1 Tax=Nonomuraea sp. NPDC050663 TaxID=3364370 RepID=UPI0037B94C3F